jgi:hypothetical protein
MKSPLSALSTTCRWSESTVGRAPSGAAMRRWLMGAGTPIKRPANRWHLLPNDGTYPCVLRRHEVWAPRHSARRSWCCRGGDLQVDTLRLSGGLQANPRSDRALPSSQCASQISSLTQQPALPFPALSFPRAAWRTNARRRGASPGALETQASWLRVDRAHDVLAPAHPGPWCPPASGSGWHRARALSSGEVDMHGPCHIRAL